MMLSTFPLRERGRTLAIFFAIASSFTSIEPITSSYLTKST